MDGFLTATYGTYLIMHSNQIRGAYNTVISALCLGLNISASTQQQTSAQPAGVLAYAQHFDRIQTESSVGSYIVSNWLTFRVRGPSQLDGDLSFGDHLLSTSSGGMTVTAGASAGTTPPNPVVTSGHDTRGRVTFGTGTGPSSGVMVHVTFNKSYVITVPSVMVVAENDATAALQLSAAPTLNGFDLRAGVSPAASQANTVYAFAWHVIG